jgi:hypothetical protein
VKGNAKVILGDPRHYFQVADYSSRIAGARSELQPRLKSDHAWTAIATQTDAQ